MATVPATTAARTVAEPVEATRAGERPFDELRDRDSAP